MGTPYLNEELQSVFHIAKALARENYNPEFGPPHLLRALMHSDAGLETFLASIGKDVHYMREWAEVRIDAAAKISHLPTEAVATATIALILESADNARLRLGLDEVSAICLLAAIVKPHNGFTPEQLRSLPLREQEIFDLYIPKMSATENGPPFAQNGHTGENNVGGNLSKYCTDKIALAKQKKLDPIIGRESETRQMIEILGRRNKPNVIIIGEPGVGKTALLDGFAQAIVDQNVPSNLQDAILLELDLGSLMAGASYKGEIEDRLKKIITELKSLDKAILFIDEMHVLLDAKGPMGSGAGNLLKPELARGEITVIGATTLEEYRKVIEPEQAFNRRFEVLQVAEPDLISAQKMVALLVPFYEKHHGIKVDKDAIPESVRLAKQYVKDKRLPDSALDLLDRTMSAIKMMDETSEKVLADVTEELEKLKTGTIFNDAEKKAELDWFYRLLKNRISPVLFGALTDEVEIEKLDGAETVFYLEKTINDLKVLAGYKKEVVGKSELAAVVAAKTGIPIGKVQAGEKEKLLNMEAYLKRRMVGQQHALKVVSDAIIESRSGVNKAGQPIGSFFFLGPTGTGKTELAKSIAELLFNDEKAMIRFDMSEFKEEHSAALLYGAPPGYVGYEEGGLLVNKIRQQPYSVVLFDEIEKAHPSVFDIFLQIMDEGHIHDKLGKDGDFSNALILFTSNMGSEFIVEKFGKNIIPTSNELMDLMAKRFRPEFLARITEIVPFGPITEEMAIQIFDIEMKGLHQLLEKQGIAVNISDEAKHKLALDGFTPRYGARQINGTIRQQIRRPISKMIVCGELQKGSSASLFVGDDGELEWKLGNSTENIIKK